MIIVSEVRCSDCLSEFKDGARFGVVKEDTVHPYSDEERAHGGHLYAVLVCESCAGWYADAIPAEVSA